MEKYVIGGIVVFLLFIMLVAIPAQHKADVSYINTWATDNGHKVAKTEQCLFSIGPYWIKGKHDRIYKADMESGRSFWFRFSLFTTDVEEYPK